MDEILHQCQAKKLELIQGVIGSRQGCKLTDEKGQSVKVVRCNGDQLIDETGEAWKPGQLSLPLRLDPDLIECLDT